VFASSGDSERKIHEVNPSPRHTDLLNIHALWNGEFDCVLVFPDLKEGVEM